MSSAAADRNLLFGILALQMDFIGRDQLVAGMHAWVLEKSTPLGRILVERKALRADLFDILEAMVQKHLEMHGNDPQASLAALSSVDSAHRLLQPIGDPDVQASLVHFAPHASPARVGDSDANAGTPTASYGDHSSDARFLILRPHARGGLGQVYVARDEELHRDVALKEILVDKADIPAARSRFLIEAEITGGLEHPGIVPVYGLGHHADGRPFYAMRFIRGDSLKDAIANYHRRASGPLANSSDRASEPLALRFRQLLGRFVDVCNAIAYAHSRGVLHRDLKPGNIMLGKYGETLVVDWGLAKAAGRAESRERPGDAEPPLQPVSASSMHETVAGTAIGTPTFMPPEQATGRLDLLGPHSDIYSLGATLYVLLFNRVPIKGEDTGEVLRKVQAGEIEWRREQDRNPVPQALAAICKKAMALRPQDRYPSALAMATDIEHWLADEPVSAYPEPWPLRTRRWMRKHRALVTSAAAVLIVATLGLLVGSALLASAYAAEQTARKGEETQRIAAQESETKAKTEAAIATAVKDFLKFDLLELGSASKQHREEQAGGLKTDPDLKIRDLVLRAAKKIEGKFQDQPLVEAEIRWTLGWTLSEIGRNDLAIPQLLRVRELCTAHLGPDHPDTLMSMNNLANSYADAGRAPEALKFREITLQFMKAKLGPDHPDTLMSMNNLASSYVDAGRAPEALKLREITLQLRKAKLGPDHPDTLKSMNNLANSYADAGRAPEALKLREITLQLMKAKLGPDHPDTLMSMNNLANSYITAGRGPEALTLREETLQLRKAKLGSDHPDTLASMNSLANSYADAGRAQEALKLYEETLLLRKAKLGPDHPATLTSMANLAISYADAGRAQEALKLREVTLHLQKCKRGPDHPDTFGSTVNLAVSYAALGRHADAITLLESAMPIMRAKMPAHSFTFNCMSNLANSYVAAGRAPEALKLDEETLQLRKAKLGPDHPDTLQSMENLALSYITVGRATNALALLQPAIDLRQRRVNSDPSNALEQSRLARTHGLTGQAEQACHDYPAATKAYAASVAMFNKLDQAGALKDPFFRGRMNDYRQQLALCQKAEQAVQSLDFALQQPVKEVPQLLDIRVRYLLKEQKLPAAVETAAKCKERASKADEYYDAACLYALCAAGAKPSLPDGRGSEKLADEAMAQLTRAVVKGYTNGAHMRQDADLEVLRDRADFQKLLAQLDAAKK